MRFKKDTNPKKAKGAKILLFFEQNPENQIIDGKTNLRACFSKNAENISPFVLGFALFFFITMPAIESESAQRERIPGTSDGPEPALSTASVRETDRPLAAGPPFTFLGPRWEIAVRADGIYRITHEELRAAGMDVDGIDPTAFQMSSQGDDVAIFVTGEADHSFDPGDAIFFYGEKFRGDRLARRYAGMMTGDGPVNNWLWQCRGDCSLAGVFEKYTDENIYWLSVGRKPGLRMAVTDGKPGKAPVPQFYLETVRAEASKKWWSHEFESEDSFFWDEIRDPLWARKDDTLESKIVTRSYPVNLSFPAPVAYQATVRAEVASRAAAPGRPDHHTRFYLNDGEVPLDDALWDGRRRYGMEARVPQSSLREGMNELRFCLLPEKHSGERVSLQKPHMYFDWFEITYARLFVAEGDRITFSTHEAGTWKYKIDGFVSKNIQVYDITDGLRPKRVVRFWTEGEGKKEIQFQVSNEQKARFTAVGADAIGKPARIARYSPPDFKGMARADYIFVTHSSFMAALKPLADYRRTQGLSVAVLDVADLYREFNFGIFHPIAIKRFLMFAFENWDQPPKYVALVGDGHWNLKGYPAFSSPPVYMPPNLAYVDPWQGEVDSTNLLATIKGLDTVPDVYMARLPVRNPRELEVITDKIMRYEKGQKIKPQPVHLFITDNPGGPGGNFPKMADRLIARYLDSSACSVKKISLKEYNCLRKADPGCETVKNTILRGMNNPGVAILTYLGHASTDAWARERVLEAQDVAKLTNREALPVLLSMTCLDGYWIHPDKPCLVKELLFSGGIIAAFSPTGLGLGFGHRHLLRGFYTAFLKEGAREMGALAKRSMGALYANGGFPSLMHTYTVFGDPALKIREWELKKR